ncbi:MAG: hypothetical protein U0105_03055 [Candidatus Obscuribacterales bacterium]
MKIKISLVAVSLTVGVMCIASAANAQTANVKAKEKVHWYNAPREFQIIDDRPIIKDFREAPQGPQQVQLPPPPQGFGGVGGGGGGANGGDDGGTMPSGGMPMQGSMPGGPYRTDGPMTGNPIPLPNARGFGAQGTNIPSRGMGPKGPLPGGFSSGIHGKIMPWAKPTPVAGAGAGRPNGMGRPSASGVANVPSAASYGGNYGPSGSASGAGGNSTSTAVHGYLLNRKGK